MITEEKFGAFNKVRESGVTNMFDTKMVIYHAVQLANVLLTKEDVIDIYRNYSTYLKQFNV